MIIATVKNSNDPRVSIVPSTVKKLLRLKDVEVHVEKDVSDFFPNNSFLEVGVKLLPREEVLKHADIVLTVKELEKEDLELLKPGVLTVSFFDPFNNKEYLEHLQEKKLSSISLEMIPRTTIAQKMDAVSSQASLAGYAAVIEGSHHMNKVFPMMMTPSGTIKPAKVFIIGAGVAGLQAIATAKRLGANVTAFDTRPAVQEQVESLGAKFLKIDLGDTGETSGGYAKELTKEQLQIQQQEMAKVIQESDLVITTAKLFGRKAPVIIKKDVVKGMKQGAVIVDLAASTGGNVEGTKLGKTVNVNGVTIIGLEEFANEVALDASIMISNNMLNLLTHFWDKENGVFIYNDDEILDGSLVTKDGELVNKRIKEIIGG